MTVYFCFLCVVELQTENELFLNKATFKILVEAMGITSVFKKV